MSKYSFSRSDDYRNLYNLVTHRDQRSDLDVATKTIFSAFLLQCLRAAGYFGSDGGSETEVLIGSLLLHFMQAFQFNTHMVEMVYENRLIAHDAETRWESIKARLALR